MATWAMREGKYLSSLGSLSKVFLFGLLNCYKGLSVAVFAVRSSPAPPRPPIPHLFKLC